MPQSLANVLVHIVFSTKYRLPMIPMELEGRLHEYVGGVCAEHDCPPLRVGGIEDHIHIACALHRTQCASDLVRDIKVASSKWMKLVGIHEFAWQGGYGVFSFGPQQKSTIGRYIANQRDHHRSQTFQLEYLELLRDYDIDYDERYVWD